MVRNPLLTDISISNLRLCCRYVDDDDKKVETNAEEQPEEEEKETE